MRLPTALGMETGRTSLKTGNMTPQDKIIMLSRARRILEGHGRVSVSEVHDIVVRLLDDELDAYLGARPE